MTPVIYVSNYVWKKQSTVGVTDLSLQECVCWYGWQRQRLRFSSCRGHFLRPVLYSGRGVSPSP